MTLKGIDVSYHQGNINWTKVKGNVDFAILRAGYGDVISYPKQIDSTFERNYKGCKDNNIPCGVYWYSYARSVTEAKQEAKACLSVIKGKTFEYPIYFDLEEQSQFAKGKAFCESIVKAFCDTLEEAGYYAGLYMSRSPLQTYISDSVAKRYALWIAEYNSKCNYGGNYGIWQYSSTGKVNGISGNVDMDYCYIDYPTVIKTNGLNGYPKYTVTTPSNNVKPIETKTLDVTGYKKGDNTIGVLSFKSLLLLAKSCGLTKQGVDLNGVFGDGTQKAVNDLLANWGYTANSVAGENFIKRLYTEISRVSK